MAIYHNNANVCSGSKGGSAVASAAYQAGEKLYSEIDKEAKDYTRKENVLDNGIVKPENAPKWCLDRERLWNEVEKKEGLEGQYCRKHDLALPKELDFEQQKQLVLDYCNYLSKQGMVCDYAIHNNKAGTNPHCHILTTMRAFDKDGNWIAKEKNVTLRDKDGKAICIGRDKKGRKRYKHTTIKLTDWDKKETLIKWREQWADLSNRALEQAGSNERISAKSYEKQGIDKMPTEHMGYAMSHLEERGIKTDRGNYNRSVKEINEEFTQLKEENENLSKVIKQAEVLYYEQSRAKLKPNVKQTLHRFQRRQNSKLSLLSDSRAFYMHYMQKFNMDKKQDLQDRQAQNQSNMLRVAGDSVADREQSGSEQQRTAETSRTRSNRRLLTLSANRVKNRTGYKLGAVTVLTMADMSSEERRAIAEKIKPILYKGLGANSEHINPSLVNLQKNSVWARSQAGHLFMLDTDKEKAIEKGLLKSNGKPKKIGAKKIMKGAKEAGGELMKAGKDLLKGLESAFDENATREDHLKQMRKNIKEIIKTPVNVIKDILTNPITAILKLPARAFEAFSNAVQAGAQMIAASTKNQPHQQAPVRKAWR